MSRIDDLLVSYKRYIETPWKDDAAPAQRVMFCVYSPQEELRLRTKIDEFELTTRNADHDWCHYDLTDTFAHWLSAKKNAAGIFKQYSTRPEQLKITLERQYLPYLESCVSETVIKEGISSNHVFAVSGVASIFGLLRVKDLIEHFAPLIQGRLLIFFPGDMPSKDNYRLLDAYDGWNYLAVAITASQEY